MILKKVYVCEFCKTEYGAERDATACEKHHVKPKSVKALRYNGMRDDACPAPITVIVTMDDRTTYVYKRGNAATHKKEVER